MIRISCNEYKLFMIYFSINLNVDVHQMLRFFDWQSDKHSPHMIELETEKHSVFKTYQASILFLHTFSLV